jgi:hypothetical protein
LRVADYSIAGQITDDEVSQLVVQPLPEGVRLTAVMDCCHSGTGEPPRHTDTHACIHTHIHTYTHTHMHTHIHTYTHTYIHTYIHTDRHTDRHTDTHTVCAFQQNDIINMTVCMV